MSTKVLLSHWSIQRAMLLIPHGCSQNVTPSHSYDHAANHNDLLLPLARGLINGVPELLNDLSRSSRGDLG